ncbi:hypothetical protein THRCLA_22072 [Thraustotheca clavata]|uniref:Uncharacterized protein n=1 Tax=Thraustotheca clavata TaxID=74557 RepID=A0A1V9ZCQ6_9STRA|nr:hypothetical protein THRCLA_22072 [Thraustotheca clavata]
MQSYPHSQILFTRHLHAKNLNDEVKTLDDEASERKNWRQKYLRKLNLSKPEDDKQLRRASSMSNPIAIPKELPRTGSELWWDDDRRSSPLMLEKEDEDEDAHVVNDDWDLGLDSSAPKPSSMNVAPCGSFVPPHEILKKESKAGPGNFRKNVVVWM